MEKLEWKDEYSVGVELIDKQHQKFVGIINEFYAAIMEKKERQILDDVFEQLVAYTVFHFQTEEKYFDEFDYEGAEEHKAVHKALIEKIGELQKKGDALLDNPFDLLDFLEDWLIKHIMGMDKLYGPCFNEHGLK